LEGTKTCAFESLTAQNLYRKTYDPFEALRVMFQEMYQELDNELFKAFVKPMGPGSERSVGSGV